MEDSEAAGEHIVREWASAWGVPLQAWHSDLVRRIDEALCHVAEVSVRLGATIHTDRIEGDHDALSPPDSLPIT